MATNYHKVKKGLSLEAVTGSAVSSPGDLAFNATSGKLEFRDNSATRSTVSEDGTQTLTNKTLTGNTAANLISGSGTLTLNTTGTITIPNATDTLVGRDTTDTLTNKVLSGNTAVTLISGAGTLTLNTTGTITVPNATDTLVARNTTDTLTNKTLTAPVIATIVNSGTLTLPTTTDTLVGRATTDTLTNKTLTGNTAVNLVSGAGTFVFNTTGTITAPNATDTLVGKATTDTLTNKTLTSPTISGSPVISGATISTSKFSDFVEIAEVATPATPASGFGRLYFKSTNKLYTLNDGGTETEVGSGSSAGINYISGNPNAETDTSGWVTYADAAGSAPVDGTGGSPTETYTRSTSSPLRGAASFLLTKDAANRQGEGVAYAMTIDSADQAKPLLISFDYAVASGTYVSGDLTVYLYDVTNSLVIQPAPYQILSAATGLSQRWIGYFQTSAASTSYRLIIHTATTSASAYTVKFDNFLVGPDQQSYGAVITDEVQNSNWTITGLGTLSINRIYERRVGDSLEVHGFVTGGTAAATTMSINLPTGRTIDTTKLAANTVRLGQGEQVATAGTAVIGNNSRYILFYDGSDNSKIYVTSDAGANAYTKKNGNTIFANNDSFSFQFIVPIAGWSSNVQVSSDTDTRVVAMFVNDSSLTPTLTGSLQTMIYNGSVTDTHSAYNSTTGIWTCPVPGFYDISAQYMVAGTPALNNSSRITILKNGSTDLQRTIYTYAAASTGNQNIYAAIGNVPLIAGDTIQIQASSNITSPVIQANASDNYFSVKRVSGPAQIAASEKVYLTYTNNGGTSITADVTNVDWTTKVVDSHNAWSGTLFTAPRSGFYHIQGVDKFTASIGGQADLYINAVKKATSQPDGANTTEFVFAFAWYMNAGDTASIRSAASGTLSNTNGTTRHWLSISSQG